MWRFSGSGEGKTRGNSKRELNCQNLHSKDKQCYHSACLKCKVHWLSDQQWWFRSRCIYSYFGHITIVVLILSDRPNVAVELLPVSLFEKSNQSILIYSLLFKLPFYFFHHSFPQFLSIMGSFHVRIPFRGKLIIFIS